MPRNITMMLFILSITSSEPTCTAPASTETSQIEIILQFIHWRNWKDALLITDCNGNITTIKRFSQSSIPISIVYNQKSFTNQLVFGQHHKHECYVIAWFSKSSFFRVINPSNTFYKRFHWLFIYESYQSFTNDTVALFRHIRVDSNVYILLQSSARQKWILGKLQFKKPLDFKTFQTVFRANNTQIIYKKIEEVTTPLLEDVNMSVTYFNYPPHSTILVDNNAKVIGIKGINHDIMLILEEYLGFKIIYDVIPDNKKKWKILMSKLRNNKADVGGMFLLLGVNQYNPLDHTSFVLCVKHIVVYQKIPMKKSAISISAYLQAFTLNSWIFITITILTCLTFSFLSSNCRLYSNNIYNNINLFLQNCLTQAPTTSSKKIFVTVLLCFNLCIISHYNSVLTASLTADNYKNPFETIYDMILDGRFMFGTYNNTPVEKAILSANKGIFRTLTNKSMYKTVASTVKAVQLMTTDYFAFICPTVNCKALNCSFEFLKIEFLQTELPLYFPRHSQYTEIFSVWILRLRSTGILNKIILPMTKSERENCHSISRNSITLRKAGMPFCVLGFGIGIAIIVFVFEKLCNN